jgi:hypothetical protein
MNSASSASRGSSLVTQGCALSFWSAAFQASDSFDAVAMLYNPLKKITESSAYCIIVTALFFRTLISARPTIAIVPSVASAGSGVSITTLNAPSSGTPINL